jgi:hypothetical protein
MHSQQIEAGGRQWRTEAPAYDDLVGDGRRPSVVTMIQTILQESLS